MRRYEAHEGFDKCGVVKFFQLLNEPVLDVHDEAEARPQMFAGGDVAVIDVVPGMGNRPFYPQVLDGVKLELKGIEQELQLVADRRLATQWRTEGRQNSGYVDCVDEAV